MKADYDIIFGRQTGIMQIIKVYLDQIEENPDMTDLYLKRILELVNESLIETRELVNESLIETRSDND